MASLKSATRIFGRLGRANFSKQGRRQISSGQKSNTFVKRSALLGAATVGGAYAVYKSNLKEKIHIEEILPWNTVQAAAVPESQPSVWSPTKEHALYLWIQLDKDANTKQCVKIVANLQKHVDAVCPPSDRDEENEIIAGVGFGPKTWKQVWGSTKKDYTYEHRSGNLGDMPSSGGDIFIHAKSDSRSKLFELSQLILKELPAKSVETCEDIYGWVYQNGRDLSGFIDGTENPAADEHRQQIAVEKATGGSYVITQKWLHRLDVIDKAKDSLLEGWVGRSREDSIELKKKPITSHVARMTGGDNFEQKKVFEIVRQSQPFGSVAGEHGLFFIGYSETPEALNYMLDRMVGRRDDKHCDDIMRLSSNVKGTYWYFPGARELKKLS